VGAYPLLNTIERNNMTDEKTGGAAFPMLDVDGGTAWQGMTLRDYFAAKAMQGILAGTLTPERLWSQDEVAETAYNVADAMLKAREA
jgi:hypothetical protein